MTASPVNKQIQVVSLLFEERLSKETSVADDEPYLLSIVNLVVLYYGSSTLSNQYSLLLQQRMLVSLKVRYHTSESKESEYPL